MGAWSRLMAVLFAGGSLHPQSLLTSQSCMQNQMLSCHVCSWLSLSWKCTHFSSGRQESAILTGPDHLAVEPCKRSGLKSCKQSVSGSAQACCALQEAKRELENHWVMWKLCPSQGKTARGSPRFLLSAPITQQHCSLHSVFHTTWLPCALGRSRLFPLPSVAEPALVLFSRWRTSNLLRLTGVEQVCNRCSCRTVGESLEMVAETDAYLIRWCDLMWQLRSFCDAGRAVLKADWCCLPIQKMIPDGCVQAGISPRIFPDRWEHDC